MAPSSDQDSLQRYAGVYGAESGQVLFVRLANRLSLDPPSTLLSSRLFLVREDGALCTLVHAGENTFIISGGEASPTRFCLAWTSIEKMMSPLKALRVC